jgi:hypothetical protein
VLPLNCQLPITMMSLQAVLTGRGQTLGESWKSIDRLVDAVDSPNITVRFDGFNPDKPTDIIDMQQFYIRASYWLYPRRVYFAEEGVVIHGGRDILESRFDPTVSWLKAHNSAGLLRMVMGADGHFRFFYDTLPPEQGN